MKMFDNILDILKGIFYGHIKLAELELLECENIFALLVYPNIGGFPFVPTYISIKLLPYIESELIVALNKMVNNDDQFVKWLSSFDVT